MAFQQASQRHPDGPERQRGVASSRDASRRHVTHVIDPNYDFDDCVSRVSDVSSVERRSPFGVPQFIRLEELNAPNRYIRDDVVFFGVAIDD